MPSLRDDEIRRLLKFLRGKTQDAEKLAFIEDELRGDFGSEFLREPEILSYFSDETILIPEAETVWNRKSSVYLSVF